MIIFICLFAIIEPRFSTSWMWIYLLEGHEEKTATHEEARSSRLKSNRNAISRETSKWHRMAGEMFGRPAKDPSRRSVLGSAILLRANRNKFPRKKQRFRVDRHDREVESGVRNKETWQIQAQIFFFREKSNTQHVNERKEKARLMTGRVRADVRKARKPEKEEAKRIFHIDVSHPLPWNEVCKKNERRLSGRRKPPQWRESSGQIFDASTNDLI